ncbi:MAG: ABC transporter permease subunit [Rhodospirillaceae bacterium]|nr:ABC transporter permease subunit [Rhodospirillaceae bacterium]
MSAAPRRLDLWVTAVPFAWLALFVALPVLIALKISLADLQVGAPPYTPLIGVNAAGQATLQVDAENYAFLLGDPLYWRAYLSSARIALISTLCALLIGFPMAYAAARAPRGWRTAILVLILLPFWTSFLIRVYAWIAVLRPGGMLNTVFQALGVIDQPLRLLNTEAAVILGIVFCYLPYMVLPLYARLDKLDPALLDAAADLGATPVTAFWRVVVPLALPGALAGCLLVFVPAVGEFVIPELMGGADTLMIGRVLWNEFFSNRDWPLAAAVSVVLLAVLVAPIALLQGLTNRGGVGR